MRVFTTARLENNPSSTRNTKKSKNYSLKVDPSKDIGKEVRGNVSGGSEVPPSTVVRSISGIVVKEDLVKGIFTDNIQTTGAYSAREESLKREVNFFFLLIMFLISHYVICYFKHSLSCLVYYMSLNGFSTVSIIFSRLIVQLLSNEVTLTTYLNSIFLLYKIQVVPLL